jgi:DNA invertase Pin-like site-specific DNA recombinase
MNKICAVYLRVSTSQQSTRSQKPDLQRWLAAQDPSSVGKVRWFTDKASGREMSRPHWDKLQREIESGNVKTLLCWRLDRLGRNSAGLAKLIETLQKKSTRLISIRENIDLASASGRLLVHILISMAAFESELKSERILAGQAVARGKGKRWGGSKNYTTTSPTIPKSKKKTPLYKLSPLNISPSKKWK